MKNIKEKIFNKKVVSIGIVIFLVIIGIIIGVLLYNNRKKELKRLEEERYNNLPIKIDISMTSYYGTITYILYELGLDFDLVTMGANCFTGVQRNEFKTDKYGILHTEFRYCEANKSLIFRVYNDENEQELRDPKPGEFPEFNQYGRNISSNSDSF